MHTIQQMKDDLCALGVCSGDTVMMHASYKSLGGVEGGAEGIFEALFAVLGKEGTLMLPAFSYDSVTADAPVFDARQTPSCVGYLPEYFRTQVEGVVRSLHATHSCCLKGKRAAELACDHELDVTPVGPHSPISKLPLVGGKILILGSHPNRNTALHGVEELVEPIYLFDRNVTVDYVLEDADTVVERRAWPHCFRKDGYFYEQRYARVIDLLSEDEYTRGKVLDADCYLLSAEAVWRKGVEALRKDPLYFVDRRQIVDLPQ